MSACKTRTFFVVRRSGCVCTCIVNRRVYKPLEGAISQPRQPIRSRLFVLTTMLPHIKPELCVVAMDRHNMSKLMEPGMTEMGENFAGSWRVNQERHGGRGSGDVYKFQNLPESRPTASSSSSIIVLSLTLSIHSLPFLETWFHQPCCLNPHKKASINSQVECQRFARQLLSDTRVRRVRPTPATTFWLAPERFALALRAGKTC